MKYRIYQDAKGKWNIQDIFTDRIIPFKFNSKTDAQGHLHLITKGDKITVLEPE